MNQKDERELRLAYNAAYLALRLSKLSRQGTLERVAVMALGISDAEELEDFCWDSHELGFDGLVEKLMSDASLHEFFTGSDESIRNVRSHAFNITVSTACNLINQNT